MQTIFQIQLQFMAGVVLLLLCRPLLNRFPKIVPYCLWCVLFLRLLCPFSLPADSAIWSMQNILEMAEQGVWQESEKDEETVNGNIAGGAQQTETGDIVDGNGQNSAGNAAGEVGQTGTENSIDGAQQTETGKRTDGINQTESGKMANGSGQTEIGTGQLNDGEDAADGTGQTEKQDGNVIPKAGNRIGFVVKSQLAGIYHWLDKHTVLFVEIWAAGILLYLSYALYAVCKYRHYVKNAIVCSDGQQVYVSGQIATPFVFGILHKKIILPQGLSDAEREYILCHEEMHIRRKDHLVKWVVFLLTGIYWFQPLVWVAAHYLEQDMEMSCDEMVIRNMGDGIKKAYAQSILSFAKGRRQEMLPLAFASGDVKWRIQNVLQTKRFRKWMIPVSVMLVMSFAVILFTEQNDGQNGSDLQQTAEVTPAAVTDTLAEKMVSDAVESDETKITAEDELSDSEEETKTMAKNAIEKNFGKFYDFNDSNTSYETFFIQRYDQYRIDDLSQWKDETGKWCYPENYVFSFNFQSNSDMAAQQFPPELLEDMDTQELLSFILQGKKTTLTWGLIPYDSYLMGLVLYYRYYNYVHELMNRADCAQVVHEYYKQYSQQDKERYSKMYSHGSGEIENSLEAVNFQFVEALEWFFLALEGKAVPDENTYGSKLERTLDNPSPTKQYIYQEDVTHDGVKDTITLNMTALYDESLATGEEETVTVTSGKTGKKIASYTADTIHYGWNGLYLYEDQEEKYLVNWKPVMYQGVGVFQLRVFSLKENGKEDVLLEKEFHFELNPGKINFDKKAYQEFIELVNDYLSNSYVIIDTDQGEVMYATKERQLMASYDGSWVLKEYQKLKK